MGRIFDLDSPVMRVLSRIADLMILNVIAAICCIPIFTIGASTTALHYVVLKLARGEEGYILKDFFKSFKTNFKQATIIWLIMLAFILIYVADIYLVFYSGIEFPQALKVVIMAVGILALVVSTYIFPVLSRFDNTIKHTIKNGVVMSILALPKSIIMLVVDCIPILIMATSIRWMPLALLFGISAPAYAAAHLYSGTFKRFEPKPEEVVEEEFHVVFDDEVEQEQGE